MSDTKKRAFWRDLIKYVIPLVISVGLCYLLFTDIDFGEMMDIIRHQCDFRWILLGFVFSIFAQVCRGMRWGIPLRALGIDAPLHARVLSIFGTYAVNLVFPRLGEVWRTGYIAQRQAAPFTTVFGSMVADRLADTVFVLLLTGFTFIIASGSILEFMHENGESYAAIARLLESPWLWAAAAAGVAGVWAFMRWKSSNSAVQKVQHAVVELWKGFAVVGTMPGKGRWLLLTLGIWGGYFTQTYVVFYAFPFTAELLAAHGIEIALVTFVLGSIAMGVPSNGGIGPWQWATMFALGIYGLGETEGGAWANLVLGTNTLMTIVLGIVTFVWIALDRKKNNDKTKRAEVPDNINS